MPKKPISNLAAAIVLHGGPSPEQFKQVLVALDEACISSEDYGFGPAFYMAETRLIEARKIMRQLMVKL